MAFRIEPHAEPIPGYKLIERLGGGGFGEVWKAEAPGGLKKAIKFVYGDLQSQDDTDGNRAEQELKALSRVKSVHHPYILSLERYDIINGQLVIVMELADRTLWDRFKECRSQGLPGLPRTELLEYMRETAEALDLMNQQFQLQHLDIKPQNLFLVFNHIKVADFGLVKDLGTMAAATVTGGVTPVYAAPETFDGWLSRFSDQYSLAIVYQELLTGQRPFTGSTVRQLVMQHLQGEPDLTMLPVADRPAVSRALAKNPEERFPTCVEFIQALRNAAAPRSASAAPSDELSALTDTADDLDPAPSSADTRETHRGRPDQWRDPLDEGVVSPINRANVLPPRPDKAAADIGSSGSPGYHEPASHLDSMPRTCLQRPRPADPEAVLTPPSEDGVTQPAFIIGLGKLGIHTLLSLRRQLSSEFGHPEALPQVRMLGIDVDPATLQAAGRGEPRAVLRNHEVALARLHRPSHYLHMRDRDGKLVTDSWLNSKLLYRIPKQINGAALRALGRLALLDNFRTLSQRLEAEVLACIAPETLQEMSQTPLGIRSTLPRVYVVCGLGGNTGSGMFLDIAYALRQILRKHGYSRADIMGLFFLPDLAVETNAVALTQTYAALAELKHYASGHEVFTAVYPRDDRTLSEAGSPFQRCRFLTLPKPKTATIAAENVPETVTLAAQYLYRDVVTPLGKTLDAVQAQMPAEMGPTWHTFGLHRVVWPRKRLLERAALQLSKRVVERWMAKDAKDQTARLTQWSQEQWEAQGLRPEALITRNLQECEKKLKRPPEQMIQEALAPLHKALAPDKDGSKEPAKSVNAAPVVSAFAALDKILGVPDECRDSNLTSTEPSVIERALKESGAAIGDRADQKLTELLVKLIEEPAFRLAGAEEALRQFSTVAEQSLRSQETLSKELNERAAVLYSRIHTLIESPHQPITQSNTIWKLGFSRKTPTSNPRLGTDLLDLIRLYAKTRFQSLVLAQVNRQYVGLRGHFSDQIREVGFCRTRLGELHGLLGDKAAASLPAAASSGNSSSGNSSSGTSSSGTSAPGTSPSASPVAAPFERLLLPTGCVKLDDAVARLDNSLTGEDLLAFDKIMQALLRHQYRALLNVCMGPSNLVRTLAPQMLVEAAKYLAQHVDGEGVAELWLTANPDEFAVRDQLLAAFDAAAPNFDGTRQLDEVTIAVLPPGEKGDVLRQQMEVALPAAQLAASDRTDEIVFYREYTRLDLSDLEQFGPEAARLYRQRCAVDPSSVHCREDLPFTQPLATAQ
jgi:eukaryotic-like serine/threonine-protein kinase